MSFEMYTPDFSNRYEISHAISIQMSVYYNAVGKLILVIPVDDYNIEAVKEDGILYDTVRKTAYIVKNVKTDTPRNRITANGYTTNWLLNRRVIAAPETFTDVESGVYNVVNHNLRGITDTRTAPPKGLSEKTNVTLYGKEVLEECMPILERAELGQRMNWDYRADTHEFEIYKGRDLTAGIHAVVFSDEQGTARDLVIDSDSSIFKNYAYVRSEFEDQEVVVEVGTAQGADRYEQWFDITLSPVEGETLDGFRERLKQHGAMELGKLIRRKSFNVVIDPEELGVVYDIGDLVSCVSRRFGVKFHARITGVKFKKDANSEVTEVILGEPKLTAIGEVKLYG